MPELRLGIEVKIGRAGAGGIVGQIKYIGIPPDAAEYLYRIENTPRANRGFYSEG
ncbi:MAG: hypothetical protein ACPL3C_11075 [Pyrobaculum sp.]|uniref:hypothetical protein n=1 Tax=Pyrobaculum sp. TaxID=2004705 RepID=UPI003CBF9A8C